MDLMLSLLVLFVVWLVYLAVDSTALVMRKDYVLKNLTEQEMIEEIKRRRWAARSKQLTDDKVDQEMRQL